jgi:hypothetical protein
MYESQLKQAEAKEDLTNALKLELNTARNLLNRYFNQQETEPINEAESMLIDSVAPVDTQIQLKEKIEVLEE